MLFMICFKFKALTQGKSIHDTEFDRLILVNKVLLADMPIGGELMQAQILSHSSEACH